jgi:hypothetical protein
MTEAKFSVGSVVYVTGRGIVEQWTVNRIDNGRAQVRSRDSGETLIVPVSDLYPTALEVAAQLFEQAGPHADPPGPDCT